MLTQQQLKEHLSYDYATGVFINLRNKPGRGGGIGSVAGNSNVNGYVYIKVMGKRYMAHRLAWLYHYGEWPVNEIDHINNIKDDNRICNLRDVTHSENQQNRIDAKWKWRQLEIPLELSRPIKTGKEAHSYA